MEQTTDSQELARRFNDDEGVWQRYEYIRARRLLCGVDSVLSDEVQDALDWLEAEHQCRQRWFVGKRLPAHDAHTETTRGNHKAVMSED